MMKVITKMKFALYLSLCICLGLVSCSESTYKRTEDGLVINVQKAGKKEAKSVCLKVISDDIIRVMASPVDTFSTRKSLIIVPQKKNHIAFDVVENENAIELTTQKIKAEIDKTTGHVGFYKLDGTPLLVEDATESRDFTPIEADGTKGYSFQEVFKSPKDEAFYGLGQHQSNEWNYKGKNEELYQYNTKVSIPFIVSNKNYGLLWDNYSLTRFGNPKEYNNISSSFKLYDKEGKEGGLTATYVTAKGKVFTKKDESEIDYENLETVNKFPKDFPFYNSEIKWEGEIEAKETGTYYFKLYYAGYTKVFVDGKEVVKERWRTAWNPNTYKFKVKLEAGKKVPVKLDWKPDGGISYIGLKVLPLRPEAEQEKLTLWSEMGQQMDYYFINGDNADDVISGYRTLTGKATILPRWAYGFWQSRERYKTQDEIVGTLKEFRKKHIPIDNIVQDWSYWKEDSWGSHQFDADRFPDPKKMIDDIHQMNGHVMISVWPKFYVTTDNYKELNQHGFIYQQAIKDSIKDWIGHGYMGSFYDPYSQEARDIFWRQMKDNLYKYGIDAWWMDASEPDIESNASMAYRKKLSTPTAIGSSTEYFNTYALENAKAIYEGQRSVDPNKRVFLLTRSGFAGLQRYSTATWSGDIGTRWEDMKAQITAGMNFALAGVPYWTMDIGGFCVEKRYELAKEGSEDQKEWRELNTRWYQFGTFAPLYRAHGQYPYRELWNIAPKNNPAYKSILYYNKLRYRLMPYIYSLAGQVYFDDYTIMRGLMMDFTQDATALNVDDQFMFGPSLMICPVCEYKAREREVYLPKCAGWYNVYNGDYLKGGQSITADAPYERMPIFAKAGSIVLVGPEIEYTNEKPDAPIKVYVYTGEDASFKMYEDEGLNFNYEKGKYAWIPFKWTEKDKVLTIENRDGEFANMVKDRVFEVVFVSKDNKETFDFKSVKGKKVKYNGTKVEVRM